MYKELNKYLLKLGVDDEQDRVDIIHDIILNEKTKNKEFFYAKKRAIDLFRREKRERERYISLNSSFDEEGKTSYEDTIIDDNENEKSTYLLERQRQLIKFLIDDADSRTLMIVETFLKSDKPTMNNVAKEISLNHNQVNRILKRLASKYDNDYFGLIDYYLYA